MTTRFSVLIATIFLLISVQSVRAQTSCGSISDPTECGHHPDCVWSGTYCFINRNYSCGSISDPTECGHHPDCVWSGTYCSINSNYGKASSLFPTIDPLHGKFSTIASIINTLLPYVLSGAGLILFAMLIWGGFSYMTAASDAKKADAGRSRITAAIIGFVIVFAAYWITQILQIIFGINILK